MSDSEELVFNTCTHKYAHVKWKNTPCSELGNTVLSLKSFNTGNQFKNINDWCVFENQANSGWHTRTYLSTADNQTFTVDVILRSTGGDIEHIGINISHEEEEAQRRSEKLPRNAVETGRKQWGDWSVYKLYNRFRNVNDSKWIHLTDLL